MSRSRILTLRSVSVLAVRKSTMVATASKDGCLVCVLHEKPVCVPDHRLRDNANQMVNQLCKKVVEVAFVTSNVILSLFCVRYGVYPSSDSDFFEVSVNHVNVMWHWFSHANRAVTIFCFQSCLTILKK